jgi:hypothetical protein
MVTWTNNEQGAVESISLVGIDNDLAFAPSVDSVRSILYLLKQWNCLSITPLHSGF